MRKMWVSDKLNTFNLKCKLCGMSNSPYVQVVGCSCACHTSTGNICNMMGGS